MSLNPIKAAKKLHKVKKKAIKSVAKRDPVLQSLRDRDKMSDYPVQYALPYPMQYGTPYYSTYA